MASPFTPEPLMPAVMTDATACERLNVLLIDLGRSLLQYACEAWPWSSDVDAADLRVAVLRSGAEQRESVAALAEMLDREGHSVDFGVYPDEYTSLHYVSLQYLLEQLMASERALISECEELARDLVPGSPASDLVTGIGHRQETILRELETLRTG